MEEQATEMLLDLVDTKPMAVLMGGWLLIKLTKELLKMSNLVL